MSIEEITPLWKHQRDAVEVAKGFPNYALFWEPGCGKSAVAVNILRHKYAEHGGILKTLVACPPIIINVWKQQFLMHSKIPEDQVVCLTGTGKNRLKLFLKSIEEGKKIFVINYETTLMPAVYNELLKFSFDVFVGDEIHRCKDSRAKRTKRIMALADKCRYRLALTGTPILQSLLDLYSQMRILDGGQTFGKSLVVYRSTYMVDVNARMPSHIHFPKWEPKPGALEEINRKISPIASVLKKEDCLELPEFIQQTIYFELSKEQQKAYLEMKNDFLVYLENEVCIASIAMVKVLKLMQITSGFLNMEPKDGRERKTIRFKENPRASALGELLRDLAPANKTIIWANFRADYETIRGVCESNKLTYVEVHGEKTEKEKNEAVREFSNNPGCHVFISNPGSGGEGITLSVAPFSIFYSRDFSLGKDIQAVARNYRPGSEKHQRVVRYDLVARSTVDEIILEALKNKQQIADIILHLKERL